jgi:hypothetical protein
MVLYSTETSLPSDLSYRAPLTNKGSNVQDGNTASYTSGGGPAKVLYHEKHFGSHIGWSNHTQSMTDLLCQSGQTSLYMDREGAVVGRGPAINPAEVSNINPPNTGGQITV